MIVSKEKNEGHYDRRMRTSYLYLVVYGEEGGLVNVGRYVHGKDQHIGGMMRSCQVQCRLLEMEIMSRENKVRSK